MRVFNVRCRSRQAEGIAGLAKRYLEEEQAWLTDARQAVRDRVAAERLSAAERSRLLVEVRRELARRRAVGELRGSRTALVTPGLRAVLAERGWLARRWRPVPASAVRHGRPWGTHDAKFDARVTLYLPDDLGELVARACYWASAPAVAKLQAWYDVHGDHWRGRLHDDQPWVGVGPSPTDLHERDVLADQVYTAGRILREAIDQTLSGGAA
jgi:hypothetical protein